MPVVVGGRTAGRPRDARRPASGGPAAVLVLLYPDEAGDARIVLIERPTAAATHSGEVSFPGGKAEPDDATSWPPRLREAVEEVGAGPGRRRRPRRRAPRSPAGSRSATSTSRPSSPWPSAPGPRGPPGRGRAHPRAAGRALPARRPVEMVERTHRRLAPALRRLRDRRPVGLGRDGPHPQPARRGPGTA